MIEERADERVEARAGAGRGVRLILAGGLHRDPRTGLRLSELLFRTRPERIVLEMSPASLAYRRGPGRAHRREIQALLAATDPGAPRAREAKELLSILGLPVEFRAALRYARESLGPSAQRPPGAPRRTGFARIRLADRSDEAVPLLEELDGWAEEVKARLLEGRDPLPWRPLPPGLVTRPPEEAAATLAREQRLARAVRRAVLEVDEARVVYAGGIEHLASLAHLLRDLHPSVRALSLAPERVT